MFLVIFIAVLMVGDYSLFTQLDYLLLGISLNEKCILHFTASSISSKACPKGITLLFRLLAL